MYESIPYCFGKYRCYDKNSCLSCDIDTCRRCIEYTKHLDELYDALEDIIGDINNMCADCQDFVQEYHKHKMT